MRTGRSEPIAYAVCCLLLWPIPLLNRLHVESAAVLAAVVFFVAGLSAISKFRRRAQYGAVLRWRLTWLLLPLALMTVPVFWAPNCDWATGLVFFVLFPGITAGFATSVAWALSTTHLRHPGRWLVGIGIAIALIGPLFDLGWHPQFYTYNHVFGGVIGPLYDEEIFWRRGLFSYRGLTVCWSLLLYLGGAWRRGGLRGWLAGSSMTAVSLLIGLVYLFSGETGINTPAKYLRSALGGHVQTAHFDIYFDPSKTEAARLSLLEDEHEFRYEKHSVRLGWQLSERIQSYIYPDPETRVRLTGARYTSVAPVWLSEPQLHVLDAGFEDVFAHELAHVFSRQMGLPILNASLSVGLVEGFAGAIEPADGRPTASEQVSAGRPLAADDDLASDLAGSMNPWGFWTGRGAVSYAVAASFVGYLLEAHDMGPFAAAYAKTDFRGAYGQPADSLASGWVRSIRNSSWIARDAAYRARRRFSVPALAERRCPHHVPDRIRLVRLAERALATADTLSAVYHLEEALAGTPDDGAASALWIRLQLGLGAYEVVRARIGDWERRPDADVALADLAVLDGRAEDAAKGYDDVRRSLPAYARDARVRLWLRSGLANHPDAIRALHRDDTEALVRLGLPESTALAARITMRLGDAARADSLLEQLRIELGPGAGGGEWVRLQLVWRSENAYRLARVMEAGLFADSAEAAYRSVGDFNEADRMMDVAEKMRWLNHRSNDTG